MVRKTIVLNNDGGIVMECVFQNEDGTFMNFAMRDELSAVPYVKDTVEITNEQEHELIFPKWNFETAQWIEMATMEYLEYLFPVLPSNEDGEDVIVEEPTQASEGGV